MIAAGVFAEDLRIELIDGEIVELAPIGDGHVRGLNLLVDDMYGQVREEAMSQRPEPDPPPTLWGATARYHPRRAAVRQGLPHVEDILLAVEVADSTIDTDRKVKLPMYAAAGIPEAWLVDMKARVMARRSDRWELPPGRCGAARSGTHLDGFTPPHHPGEPDLRLKHGIRHGACNIEGGRAGCRRSEHRANRFG